jgi:4-diphosphocytidyl-2-C-methyl-D-erythritol kinase
LNELFGQVLAPAALNDIAASLGSDIPFFLQEHPALATGRGEQIQSLPPFPALANAAFVLVHPGFGISTPWAYGQLANFPEALNGEPGRCQKALSVLNKQNLSGVGAVLYNSLEAPALKKFPLLVLFQDFFREHGADATLMSGSGSTTFAIARNETAGQQLAEEFKAKFGNQYWVRVVNA